MQPTTRGQAAPAMDEQDCEWLVDRMLALQIENEGLRWRNALLSEQLAALDRSRIGPWAMAGAALAIFLSVASLAGVLYSWTHAAGQ